MFCFPNIFADSPSFVTQEIVDKAKDWNITVIESYNVGSEIPTAKILCDKLNDFIETPDIKSVKYVSDGKLLKGNVYLTFRFNYNPYYFEEYDKTALKEILQVIDVNNIYRRYSMIVDTKSVFDSGPDYGVERLWSSPINKTNWYKSIFELSSDGNFTQFSGKLDTLLMNNSNLDIPVSYSSLPFDFDLNSINSPGEYNVNILFEEGYKITVNEGSVIYCNRADVSQWMPVPQPEISISFSSNSIDLRPHETATLLVKIENNANLNARISNSYDEEKINVDILPNPIFVSPSSNATAVVKIKSPSSESQTIPVKIKSQIEFPQNITIIGTKTTITNVSDAIINVEREFTVNLLPEYRIDEYLSIFVDRYITPLNSIWTFFSGIAIALSPQIIRSLQKFFTSKRKEEENQGTKTRKF